MMGYLCFGCYMLIYGVCYLVPVGVKKYSNFVKVLMMSCAPVNHNLRFFYLLIFRLSDILCMRLLAFPTYI